MKSVFLSGVACLFSIGAVMAQTTLSGDHIITGDLDVGTTGTPGNLEVSGETGNTASPGIKVTGDGGVLFEGASGTGQIPATGAGTRLLWYPKKAAFRVGHATGSQWSDSEIGMYSMAFGQNGIASGTNSTAFGSGVASGENSFAVGGTASGNRSTGLSGGMATEEYAVAFQNGWASWTFAFAVNNAEANGHASFATGTSYTVGPYSTGLSAGMTLGEFSTAVSGGQAIGDFSVAIGNGTQANSYRSVAVGSNSSYLSSENQIAWVETDPIFIVGNGTGDGSDPPEIRNRNALTVYKNGKIKMDRQGDILMGEFGNPE